MCHLPSSSTNFPYNSRNSALSSHSVLDWLTDFFENRFRNIPSKIENRNRSFAGVGYIWYSTTKFKHWSKKVNKDDFECIRLRFGEPIDDHLDPNWTEWPKCYWWYRVEEWVTNKFCNEPWTALPKKISKMAHTGWQRIASRSKCMLFMFECICWTLRNSEGCESEVPSCVAKLNSSCFVHIFICLKYMTMKAKNI